MLFLKKTKNPLSDHLGSMLNRCRWEPCAIIPVACCAQQQHAYILHASPHKCVYELVWCGLLSTGKLKCSHAGDTKDGGFASSCCSTCSPQLIAISARNPHTCAELFFFSFYSSLDIVWIWLDHKSAVILYSPSVHTLTVSTFKLP